MHIITLQVISSFKLNGRVLNSEFIVSYHGRTTDLVCTVSGTDIFCEVFYFISSKSFQIVSINYSCLFPSPKSLRILLTLFFKSIALTIFRLCQWMSQSELKVYFSFADWLAFSLLWRSDNVI